MKNTILCIILCILGGMYAFTKRGGQSKDRNFSKDLIALDTTLLQSIAIHHPSVEPFSISRQHNDWILQTDNISVQADESNVNALLSQFMDMQTKQLVSKSQDKWSIYEVDDEKGTTVTFNTGSNQSELVVGKFNFNQQKREANTYIRKGGQDNTYLVEGFIGMNLSKDANSYRNQDLLSIPTSKQIDKIEYVDNQKDISLIWERKDKLNEKDSIIVKDYLRKVSNIRGSVFYDKKIKRDRADYIITFDANQDQITLSGYQLSDDQFVVHSSQNPTNYFQSKKQELFKKIFQDFAASL